MIDLLSAAASCHLDAIIRHSDSGITLFSIKTKVQSFPNVTELCTSPVTPPKCYVRPYLPFIGDVATFDWFNIPFIMSFDSGVCPKALFFWPDEIRFGVAVCVIAYACTFASLPPLHSPLLSRYNPRLSMQLRLLRWATMWKNGTWFQRNVATRTSTRYRLAHKPYCARISELRLGSLFHTCRNFPLRACEPMVPHTGGNGRVTEALLLVLFAPRDTGHGIGFFSLSLWMHCSLGVWTGLNPFPFS